MAQFWRDAALPRGPGRVARLRQSEKSHQSQVLALAKLHHWATYHTWRSTHSAAGFPDVVAIRPPRCLFLELKTETGVVSPPQRAWLDALARCPGVEVYTIRPSDWALLEALLA